MTDQVAEPRRSSFFFIGRLEPGELANFNVQNVELQDRGAILEVFGHAIAIWWPAQPREDFNDLLDGSRGWIQTVAAAYYLETSVPLEASLTAWVEALDVDVREAMIGVIDARFAKVAVKGPRATVNVRMRASIQLARKIRGRGGELERATHELLSAANDSGPQSLLSAYRALECLRRLYEPEWDKRFRGWKRMAADIGDDPAARRVLSKAVQAVRHGNLPDRRSETHAVNTARAQRDALLSFVRELVRAKVDREVG